MRNSPYIRSTDKASPSIPTAKVHRLLLVILDKMILWDFRLSVMMLNPKLTVSGLGGKQTAWIKQVRGKAPCFHVHNPSCAHGTPQEEVQDVPA